MWLIVHYDLCGINPKQFQHLHDRLLRVLPGTNANAELTKRFIGLPC